MIRKIITYFLILAVVLPILASAVPLPASRQALGVSIAHAEDTTEKTGDKGEVIDPCGSMAGLFKGSFWDCAAFTFVNFFYNFLAFALGLLIIRERNINMFICPHDSHRYRRMNLDYLV